MTNYEKLRDLLRELFQLEQARELDFGIYRIIRQREKEISAYLDNDLLPQVKQVLAEYASHDQSDLKIELAKLVESVAKAGMNPDDSPKVQELRQKLGGAVDLTALENEVFSHLYNFFRRYYSDGDFISMRRYKDGVYAIPYEGEEVKLHWANADQYYIKSSEYLRDFTFHLPSGRRVHFKLVNATTEQDNRKEEEGKERRFKLAPDNAISIENEELVVRFVFERAKLPQKKLNEQSLEAILGSADIARGLFAATQGKADMVDWVRELAQLAPTESNPKRTVIEKHLTQYTARNTFDYFIHKDLGKFLRREMDFYIKNEMMHLDDIEGESAPKVESYLGKVRAFRQIAAKIIALLVQLEDFQKKLWLKKKFVVETNYCVTLDLVPEELHAEVLKNREQLAEWEELFHISQIQSDLFRKGGKQQIDASFLKSNRFLVVDTRYFGKEFRDKLLASIGHLDEHIAGVAVNGENFQSLRLLENAFRARVKCVYIDPPYNTGNDGFSYKDSFKHSSWLALMHDRLRACQKLMGEGGAFWVSIDDRESHGLRRLMDDFMGAEALVSDIAVVNNFKGRQDRDHIATAHEHLFFYAREGFVSYGFPLAEEKIADYDQKDSAGLSYQLRDLRKRGGNDTRSARPNLYFPLYWKPKTKVMSLTRHGKDDVEILPVRSDGVDGCWRWGKSTVEKNLAIIEGRQVTATGKWNASYRVYLENDGQMRTSKPKSFWAGTKYSSDGAIKTLRDMLPSTNFASPKSVGFMVDIVTHSTTDDEVVLDFFAGSGTTGQAVIAVNRRDEGQRKYVLVEQGDFFLSTLLPRIKKSVYSKDWSDGKPVSREGSSHLLKYLQLESYEDCLCNLKLTRTEQQQKVLQSANIRVREQYILSYMLDVEATQSLLHAEVFRSPDNHMLKVQRGDATVDVSVDLPETFNYLLGMTVKLIDVIRGVRVVSGVNPDGERVLVLWRNLDEMNSDDLDKWFMKQGYNTQDMEYDLIYVNGDNHLENLRRSDQTWKVRLIEEEFQRLMFDVQDV